MFISMVNDYYMATGDMEFILEMLPWLEKEFQFWLNKRSTPVKDQTTDEELFHYFQYRATLRRPRPESYREDLELVK